MAISNLQYNLNNNLLTSKQLNFIPPFSGFLDSQSIIDFFHRVEEVADHFGWSDSSKYLAVKLRVTEDAKQFTWGIKFKDYDSLKNVLLEHYNRKPLYADLVKAFISFQQPPDMPVSEFLAKATMLSFKIFCRGEDSREVEEANRVTLLKAMLLGNLKPEILRGVIATNPQTIEEIKEAALLQERAWNSYNLSVNSSVSNETYSSQVNAVQTRVEKAQNVEDICHQLSEKVEILTAKVTDLTRQSKQSQLCKTRPGHLARFNPRKHDSKEVRQSFRYGQNSSESIYSNALPQHCPSYPYSENNFQQSIPTVVEEGARQESVTRLEEKAFSGYVEVSQNEVSHTLTRKHEETVNNKELVFRNDEESPSPQEENVNNPIDRFSENQRYLNEEKEGRKIETGTSVCEQETRVLRKSEFLQENKSEMENVQESHPISEKEPALDTGKPNDNGFPLARDKCHSLKLPSAYCDDKIRDQQIEERKKSDRKARKRRAGQVKHLERSKRLALAIDKSFEKSDEDSDIHVDRRMHNKESSEGKYFGRNYRSRDNKQRNRFQYDYPQFPFAKHFQTNVPPRFQKSCIECFRKKVPKQTLNQSGRAGSMSAHIRYSLFKRRKRKRVTQ